MRDAERTIDTSDDPAAAEPDSSRGPVAERDDGAGTPPTGDDDASPDTAAADAPTRRVRRVGVLAYVAVTAFLLDLATKIVAVELLEHRAPVEILGEWLRLELVRNSGAAFGMGQTLTVALTCIAAVVVVVILRLARKLYSTPWAIALGLLLGGALGNLTDRIFRAPSVFEGAVVDFVSPKHFAVFNVADSAIVCGGILIVVLSFRGLDPDGTVHRDEDTDAGKRDDSGDRTDDNGVTSGTDRDATPGGSEKAEDTGDAVKAEDPEDTGDAVKVEDAEDAGDAVKAEDPEDTGDAAKVEDAEDAGDAAERTGSGASPTAAAGDQERSEPDGSAERSDAEDAEERSDTDGAANEADGTDEAPTSSGERRP